MILSIDVNIHTRPIRKGKSKELIDDPPHCLPELISSPTHFDTGYLKIQLKQ